MGAANRTAYVMKAARRASDEPLEAIAHSLVAIAMQGEERITIDRNRETGFSRGFEAGRRIGIPLEQFKQMHGLMEREEAGKPLDSDVIAYESGKLAGLNEERARWLGSTTKELIDAALEMEDHLRGRRTGPPAKVYDRLIAAAKAYRELMTKEQR